MYARVFENTSCLDVYFFEFDGFDLIHTAQAIPKGKPPGNEHQRHCDGGRQIERVGNGNGCRRKGGVHAYVPATKLKCTCSVAHKHTRP